MEIEFYKYEVFTHENNIAETVFRFQKRIYLIKDVADSKFSVNAGSGTTTSKVKSCSLLVEKKDADPDLWVAGERACDLLTLSSNNHVVFYSLGQEYPLFGFGKNMGIEKIDTKELDDKKDSQLSQLASKIDKFSPKLERRILSAIHLSRLSKIKLLSHITESLTDGVCAIESIYMEENSNGYYSNFDRNIIPKEISGKERAFKWFVKEYSDLNFSNEILELIRPYTVRSAYLHKGILVEPDKGGSYLDLSSKEKAEEVHHYNLTNQILYNALLNFINTD